jgi:hypothetical protein
MLSTGYAHWGGVYAVRMTEGSRSRPTLNSMFQVIPCSPGCHSRPGLIHSSISCQNVMPKSGGCGRWSDDLLHHGLIRWTSNLAAPTTVGRKRRRSSIPGSPRYVANNPDDPIINGVISTVTRTRAAGMWGETTSRWAL